MVTDHGNMTAEKENASLNVISSTAMETVSEDKLQVLKGKRTTLWQMRDLNEANNALMLIQVNSFTGFCGVDANR